MSRALLLSVRFHEGRFHGQNGQKTPEWPPSPARLFQALVAGAANGVANPTAMRGAFEWLENLDAPIIAAPVPERGQYFQNFVPNNDRDAVEGGSKTLASIRTGKTIKPHVFDMEFPVMFMWQYVGNKQNESHARTICDAAEGLYQLGRGVDMAWAQCELLHKDEAEKHLAAYNGTVHRPSRGREETALPCPQRGSLNSLDARFAHKRFVTVEKGRTVTRTFHQPPKPQFRLVAYDAPPQRLIFTLCKGDARGEPAPWPLAGAARLVEYVRDAAAENLRKHLSDRRDEIERCLIGRGATDSDKARRVRIVPVPSVGHPHADMAIRRLAVDAPQACPLRADDLAWAFRAVWTDGDGVVVRELQSADENDSMVDRFTGRARTWRSVTPLALPVARGSIGNGTARRDREASAAGAVRRALRHAGVHVAPLDIRVQREPFDTHGERAESFADGTRFSEAALWHVAIAFATPVAGPLLLGNGRYLGLGLMRPEAHVDGVIASTSSPGLPRAPNP